MDIFQDLAEKFVQNFSYLLLMSNRKCIFLNFSVLSVFFFVLSLVDLWTRTKDSTTAFNKDLKRRRECTDMKLHMCVYLGFLYRKIIFPIGIFVICQIKLVIKPFAAVLSPRTKTGERRVCPEVNESGNFDVTR